LPYFVSLSGLSYTIAPGLTDFAALGSWTLYFDAYYDGDFYSYHTVSITVVNDAPTLAAGLPTPVILYIGDSTTYPIPAY
jgi:hypothetical protein